MKISIITVCYNSADTIEETIKSVLSQSYIDIEYIIVDGGSEDSTLDIIKKFDSKITKCVSEPDKGLYDAMNKGIALATGDLVGILNSDDVFFNNIVIESIANFHKNKIVDASISNVLYKNSNGKIIRNYSVKGWKPTKLKQALMPPHAGIFFKRKLFKKYGVYRLDFKIGADYELITRFFIKHNISWELLDINTTIMLVGGVSSSGIKSYKIITNEIIKALIINDVSYNYLKIQFRFLKKIYGLIITYFIKY